MATSSSARAWSNVRGRARHKNAFGVANAWSIGLESGCRGPDTAAAPRLLDRGACLRLLVHSQVVEHDDSRSSPLLLQPCSSRRSRTPTIEWARAR
jgi:hypothetical protein